MKRMDGSRRLLLIAGVLFLIVIVAIDRWGRRASAPGAGGKAAVVVDDGGLATDPAVSPDGKLLAYASDRAQPGNLDVWVRPLAGGEPRRLTSWPEDDSQPAFSPKGERIAFRSEHGEGGLYTVAAAGGEPKLLAAGGRTPRFSPDGNWIAYAVRRAGREDELWLAPAGGGEPRRLAPKFTEARHPVWSEDGRHLLFSGRDERRPDWWVIPVDGGEPVRTGAHSILHMQGFSGDIEPAVWRGDGVLFCGRFRDRTTVWQAPMSSTHQCSGRATQVADIPAARVARAPDGTLLVSAIASKPGIWTLARDGQLQQVPVKAAPRGRLSVSRDGRTLLYWTENEVMAKDLASGAEKKIAHEIEGNALVGAGGTLFFGRHGSIHTAALNGGEPKRLCEHCGEPWSLSADGTRLLFQPGWRRGVGLLYTATRERRELMRRDGEERRIFRAQFSPDGRWLLLEAGRGREPRRIYVAPFREGASPGESDWITLTDGKNQERSACWSGDGSLVHYISDRDGFPCVWAQKPKGGEAFAVRHFHEARRSLGEGQMAAAQDKLFLVLNETTGGISRLK